MINCFSDNEIEEWQKRERGSEEGWWGGERMGGKGRKCRDGEWRGGVGRGGEGRMHACMHMYMLVCD